MKNKKKSLYTPGPWVLRNRTLYGATPSGRIAELHSGWDETFEANARLIAAAPQLVEAGKKLERLLHYWRVGGKPDLGSFTKAHDELQAALKAAGVTI